MSEPSAYSQRNKAVLLALALAKLANVPIAWGVPDAADDPDNEGWPVVYFQLGSAGPVTFHIDPKDAPGLMNTESRYRLPTWDGADKEETMARVDRFVNAILF